MGAHLSPNKVLIGFYILYFIFYFILFLFLFFYFYFYFLFYFYFCFYFLFLVTEKLDGDLETLTRNNNKLSLYSKMKMAKEASQGIAWLHGQNPRVVHR